VHVSQFDDTRRVQGVGFCTVDEQPRRLGRDLRVSDSRPDRLQDREFQKSRSDVGEIGTGNFLSIMPIIVH